MTTDALGKLQDLLSELFQFESKELDFGIYRIMNHKRREIRSFIDEGLPRAVDEALKGGVVARQAADAEDLRQKADRLREDLGPYAIDAKGELNEIFRETPRGREYEEARSRAGSAVDLDGLKATIFNHVFTFFARYYDNGDFLSKRRYSRREKYAVPYNGEEVYLHWANADQYYVKTGEHFTDYRYKSDVEDRESAGLDIDGYWSGGISPGDWKDIVGRCSKVFAGYGHVPLATAIQKLKIRSERKGFGRDVYELIKAKNDYKHDRGPTDLEEIANASDQAQARLRRCMEALAFFAEHPISRVGHSNASHADEPIEGDLFLDVGDGRQVPLYPFIASITDSRSSDGETYFIDAWDRKRDSARMKSFERGRTVVDHGVSRVLAEWKEDCGAARATAPGLGKRGPIEGA